jgi:hypothetical protein
MHQAALGIGDVVACERLDKTLALVAWFDQIVRPRPSGELCVVQRLDGQPTTGQREFALLARQP